MDTERSKPPNLERRGNFRGAGLRSLWLIVPGLCLALSAAGGPRTAQFVPGRIVIKSRSGLSETNFNGKLKSHGVLSHRALRLSDVRLVSVPEEKVEAALAALRQDPDVEFAERDYRARIAFTVNDPLVASGAAWHLAKIQADAAWDFTAGRSGVVVAVLDSGVNAAQPDLAGRIFSGYNFVSNNSNPSDDFGHGTAVAGTIVAAGNNGAGAAGVAFGCRVLPVKVVDSDGYASYSDIAQGIRYAVDHGARVINISVAGEAPSSLLQDAVNYAWNRNVIIVASAGNYSDDVRQYPAACEHALAVSATAPDDSLATFSSFGDYVALSAPGSAIWTTQRDPSRPYGSWSGSSFAAPIVAGTAALVASENPTLAHDRIVSILKQTADDRGAAGYDPRFGHGRVNAFRAVVAASLEPGALPPEPPIGNLPPIVEGDTNPPSIRITSSPANGARLDVPQILLSGSAHDDAGVQRVEVEINGTTHQADGAETWSLALDLSPGLNVVHARSFDFAGNASPGTTRRFTCVVRVPLAMRTNGFGRIIPNLDGKALEIGKVFKVKAVPGPGHLFAGWNGAEPSSSVLTFVMKSNLTFTATFVPTPFGPVKGSYAGLMANTNGVLPESSGSFRLSVTSLGRFTGTLRLAGERHGFQGRFNLAGDALVSVRRKHRDPLMLALRLDLANTADRVTGRLTDGGWTSELDGNRDVFHAKWNPAQQAGRREFILARADDTSVTAAKGLSSISTGGSTRVKGRLNDGRPFATASRLGGDGDYPFYLSFKRGSEVVIGWLNFPGTPEPVTGGTVVWVQTGTNAFAATLEAQSAPGN